MLEGTPTQDQLPPYRGIENSAQALRAAGFMVETSVDDRARSVADAAATGPRAWTIAQRLACPVERHGRVA